MKKNKIKIKNLKSRNEFLYQRVKKLLHSKFKFFSNLWKFVRINLKFRLFEWNIFYSTHFLSNWSGENSDSIFQIQCSESIKLWSWYGCFHWRLIWVWLISLKLKFRIQSGNYMRFQNYKIFIWNMSFLNSNAHDFLG